MKPPGKKGKARPLEPRRSGARHGLTPKSQGVGSQVKHRIFLVDDHPIVREGLAELINREKNLLVVGQAETAPEALGLIGKCEPDLALIDMTLKAGSGLELIKAIKAQNSRILVLVLSMHDENLYAERALRAGARGYIMKQEAGEKILTAIQCVLSGGLYISEAIKEKLLEFVLRSHSRPGEAPESQLSDRELEVFGLIGSGYTTRQIAVHLGLSVKTIESYRENLKIKLGLNSGTELLQRAIQWGKRLES